MKTIVPKVTVRDEINRYLGDNDLPSDGGHEEKWIPLKFGFLTFYIYNSESRKQAVKLHDIHHAVTGYKSDLCGESEISAWELAAGIHNKYFAGFIGLTALFYGAFLYPKRTFKAFIRGKYSRSLYSQDYTESLLKQNVEDLKSSLLPQVKPKVRFSYSIHYFLLVGLACLPIIILIMGAVFFAVNHA